MLHLPFSYLPDGNARSVASRQHEAAAWRGGRFDAGGLRCYAGWIRAATPAGSQGRTRPRLVLYRPFPSR